MYSKMIHKFFNKYKNRRKIKNNKNFLKQKVEEKNNDNIIKVETGESLGYITKNKNKNVVEDIKQKRKRILLNAIKYLSLNNVSVRDYLTKNIFPSRPYELRGSEEFFDAVKFNDIELVNQGLQRSHSYLNQYDYFRQTPIHWAAKLGYYDLLKVFVKYTKLINTYDRECRTPIFLAALNNHKKCVEILLENGGNAYIHDKNGDLPDKVTTDENIKFLLQASNDKQFGELNEINKRKLKIFELK